MSNQHGRQSDTDYHIHLNFLLILDPLPRFQVFRKLRAYNDEARPYPDVMSYRLPKSPAEEKDWPSFWVPLSERDDYSVYESDLHLNPHLSCRMLHHALQVAAEQNIQADKFRVPENPFISEVAFIQRTHEEGNEQLEVPTLLPALNPVVRVLGRSPLPPKPQYPFLPKG